MELRLLEDLKKRPLVGDGAMGTMLQNAGLGAGECGEVWNVEAPDKVKEIQKAYLEAGSDLILSNTFGGSRLRLAENGYGERTRELNRAGAKISREVADQFKAFVLGDMGPSGQLMEPLGEVSEEQMTDSFREQAMALVEGGVHALIVETMTSKDEMIAALTAATEAAAGEIPVIASYSFNQAGGSFRTMMGETIEDCVQGAIGAGASIVGTNCGMGIDEMIKVVAEIRKVTEKPIMAQPNAGLPEVVGGKVVYKETPEMMADKASELIKAGANIIGGCCGTNPDFIRLLKDRVATASA